MPEQIESAGRIFHAREGWYFKRLEDGRVEIFVTETPHSEAPIARSIMLDPESWASVVASVSRDGESAETWRAALNFHGGESF